MDKIAVVTGGTTGIGASISRALHSAGYKVIANYFLDDHKADAFAKSTGIEVMKWNVSDFDECQAATSQIEKQYGKNIDVLVNNAGVTRDAHFHKMSKEDWQDVMHLNLDSCFNMTRSVIDGMHKDKSGKIINIASINDHAEITKQTNYSTAKAALIGFTKALAAELAPRNITVNVVLPGYIMTELAAEKIPAPILEKITKIIPMARLGKPEDVSKAVLFLASSDAGYITGETLSVNGGHEIL